MNGVVVISGRWILLKKSASGGVSNGRPSRAHDKGMADFRRADVQMTVFFTYTPSAVAPY